MCGGGAVAGERLEHSQFSWRAFGVVAGDHGCRRDFGWQRSSILAVLMNTGRMPVAPASFWKDIPHLDAFSRTFSPFMTTTNFHSCDCGHLIGSDLKKFERHEMEQRFG